MRQQAEGEGGGEDRVVFGTRVQFSGGDPTFIFSTLTEELKTRVAYIVFCQQLWYENQ